MAMGKKRLTASILLTALLMLLSKGLYTGFEPIKLSFDIKGEKTLSIQAFYTKKTIERFNEKESSKQEVDLNVTNHLEFLFPTQTVRKVRIDLGSNPEDLELSNIVLEGKKKLPLNNFDNIEIGQLDNIEKEADKLKITSSQVNPSISFNNGINIKAGMTLDWKLFIIALTLSFLISYKLVQYLAVFKIKENHSRIDIVFVFAFFIFLFVPMMKIDNADKSERENRMLAKYIPLFNDGKINNNFGKDFETWYNDRFLGRKEFIKFHSQIMAKLNYRQGNDKVLIGKDGWLFYKTDNGIRNFQNLDLFSDSQLKNIADYLQKINDWCKANNKQFIYFLTADKNKIYGEYFRFVSKINSDEKSRANQLVNYLKEHTDVKVIYTYDIMHEHKKAGDLLYWKNDTHWNELGAYFGYRELMSAVGVAPLKVTNFETVTNPVGDITDMYAARVKPDNDTLYKKPIFSKTYTCNKYEEREDIYCKNPQGKGKIAMFRDSYSINLLPYLAQTFKQVSMYWRYEIRPSDLKYLQENADIIVIEQVERFVPKLSLIED